MLRSWWAGPLLLVGAALPVAAADTAGAAGAAGAAWVWPLTGPVGVTRPFAPGPTRFSAGHYGADLAAPTGAVVRAAGAGRVSYAGLLAGRGVVVVVHGALRTTYEPVAATVRVGDRVAAGGPLGRVTTGHPSCGAASCLHWGLRRGADYLDPVRLVGAAPVRLLPLREAPGVAGSHADPAQPVTAPGSEAAAPAPAATAAPSPLPAPGWGLRAADVPLGSVALLALLAGLALVRTSPRPASPPRAAAPPAGLPDDERPAADAPHPPAVDLDGERRRRRAGA
jgi:murein DD-endopeptidase MepM/ murein hydrolase activator NlpD